MELDLNCIMEMLDWNRPEIEQEQGIEFAKKVEDIRVFLQPCGEKYNKNVWDNCAKVLSSKTDRELDPYLTELLEWLQDMNWPGAFCVLDRLNAYEDNLGYRSAYELCVRRAQKEKDEVWENNLSLVKK